MLSGSFTQDEVAHITELLNKPEVLSNGKQALADYTKTIHAQYKMRTAEDTQAFVEAIRNKKGMVDKHG